LQTVRRCFGFAAGAEITSEANPGSLTPQFVDALLSAGGTRLSLGVQSLDDAVLERLGRVHTRAVAEDAVALARRGGVPSLSLDFIYGVPAQDLAHWRRTLHDALALGPDHISAYGLIVEEATAFGRAHAQGRLQVPDDDLQDDMYEHAVATLAAAGYAQYEISNYARPGHASRHNLVYWDNGAYVGVGCGAVSYVNGWRWTKTRRPAEYIRRVRADQTLVQEGERVCDAVGLSETLLLGLRTRQGVDVARAAARYPSLGLNFSSLKKLLAALLDGLESLVIFDGGRLVLTEDGLALSNGVMERLLELNQHLTSETANDTLISV
jgi:oxygen-independent coproporphyrinogen-3 oxidase